MLVSGSTTLHSTPGNARPTVPTRTSRLSPTLLCVQPGELSVCPNTIVMSDIFILSTTSFITGTGQGEQAIIPVRMWLKSVVAKSACSSKAINIVGTPCIAVIFSLFIALSDTDGWKYSIGTMVVPCEIEAVIARTMPKQWNIGTWISMRSSVDKSIQSPMHLPLFITL